MTELLAVVAITLFAVISPGPDFAMVSRNSLLLSRRTGVLTAIGIAAGVCVHVTYTLLGALPLSTPDCRVLFFMPWQPLFGRIGAHFEVR